MEIELKKYKNDKNVDNQLKIFVPVGKDINIVTVVK